MDAMLSGFRYLTFPRKAILTGVVATCSATWYFSWSTLIEERSLLARRQVPRANSTLRTRLDFYNKHLVLNKDNIREGRYHTLLTHTITHNSFGHFFMNMTGVISFGIAFLQRYSVGAFAVMWVGAGIAGGVAGLLGEERKAKKINEERVKNGMGRVIVKTNYVGASAAALGVTTAMCLNDLRVNIRVTLIPVPGWLFLIGFPVGSIVADQINFYPYVGHLAHVAGMAFGALFWLLRLKRMPFTQRTPMFHAQSFIRSRSGWR